MLPAHQCPDAKSSTYQQLQELLVTHWIFEDISNKIDIGQFSGQEGTGTEHMLVCLVDSVLSLLDKHTDQLAFIAAAVDWAAAFDSQDPTLAIKSCIEIGVRPALIPVLISYLSERQMKVKCNGEESNFNRWGATGHTNWSDYVPSPEQH